MVREVPIKTATRHFEFFSNRQNFDIFKAPKHDSLEGFVKPIVSGQARTIGGRRFGLWILSLCVHQCHVLFVAHPIRLY